MNNLWREIGVLIVKLKIIIDFPIVEAFYLKVLFDHDKQTPICL